jgi:hypothetical protein
MDGLAAVRRDQRKAPTHSRLQMEKETVQCQSVANPRHFDADPDQSFHFKVDPDPTSL